MEPMRPVMDGKVQFCCEAVSNSNGLREQNLMIDLTDAERRRFLTVGIGGAAGLAPGYPAYDGIERRLAEQPVINESASWRSCGLATLLA
jgi:hypothetical protein